MMPFDTFSARKLDQTFLYAKSYESKFKEHQEAERAEQIISSACFFPQSEQRA